jgi:DNA polymerase III epsilon subunit-like protein
MYSEEWIIIDTETSGLNQPIYVVEIAAQRMKGWQRDGDPFRVLLNHDVPIEPMAESLHGYSRDYLRKHGEYPHLAHEQFSNYCGERPVVAYNLSYDWDRALYPEYERLRRPAIGKKGFCALTLARRTVKETVNYKLETLKQHFRLSIEQSHRGKVDVEVLTRLLQEIIGPRLHKAGVFGLESVTEFSRRTPVAKCLEHILVLAIRCGIASMVSKSEVLTQFLRSDQWLKRTLSSCAEMGCPSG